jgi:hypothetical protein
MSFAPIAGNESFSNVENVASAVRNLDLSSGSASNLSADVVNFDKTMTDAYVIPFAQQLNLTATPPINTGNKRLYRTTGWLPHLSVTTDTAILPNDIPAGATADTGVYFNNEPLQPAATLNTDPQLLLLPVGATIVGAGWAPANGTALTGAAGGDASSAIATVASGTAAAPTLPLLDGSVAGAITQSVSIATGIVLATLGSYGGVGIPTGGVSAAGSVVGGAGSVIAPVLSNTVTADNQAVALINLLAGGATFGYSSGGDLAVNIYYLLDE